MKEINVGKEFFFRLGNRDSHQGDGLKNAVEFREKYLKELDNQKEWDRGDYEICLDFSEVKKIGPSFANEAFAYFTKYASPENILIKIKNITNVKMSIIKEELEEGYRR